MFRRADENVSDGTSGTSSQLRIAPTTLRRLFGEPDNSDGYKVSGEYEFINDEGHVFTVYDWKSTSLYDDCYPNPSDIWMSDKPFCFRVGSNHKGNVREFIQFIYDKEINVPFEKEILKTDTNYNNY